MISRVANLVTVHADLALVQFSISAAGLLVASVMDLKKREVEDYVWWAMLLLSAPILLARLRQSIANPVSTFAYAVSLLTGIAISTFLAKVEMMGGADAKAIIVLSVTELPEVEKGVLAAVPPLSILACSALLSLLSIPYILSRNLAYYLKSGSLFEGFEKEPLWKKALCLISAYRVKYGEYLAKEYMYSLAEEKADGRRRLVVGVRIREEARGEYEEGEEVWVSPLLPMIAFIATGYITYRTAIYCGIGRVPRLG